MEIFIGPRVSAVVGGNENRRKRRTARKRTLARAWTIRLLFRFIV